MLHRVKSTVTRIKHVTVDYAAEQSHQAVMFNMGQVCTAGSRTYVQEEIYDEFVKKCVEKAKNRTVGDPFDEKSQNGPQVILYYNITGKINGL